MESIRPRAPSRIKRRDSSNEPASPHLKERPSTDSFFTKGAIPPSPALSFIESFPGSRNVSGSSIQSMNDGTLTPSTLLARLEAILVAKSNEIQQAGRLGEKLLQQQAELESKIHELEQEAGLLTAENTNHRSHNDGPHYESEDEAENGVNSEEVKRKLKDLEQELRKWDEENEEYYKDISQKPGQAMQDTQGVLDAPFQDADHATPIKSAQANRRLRNNDATQRANDIEFATEIGQSLLGEVRRLQALLTERDDAIATLSRDRDGLSNLMDEKDRSSRTLEEAVDRYKEENWNLEVALQEIRSNHTELTTQHSKSESEKQKTLRNLAVLQSETEAQKAEIDRLNKTIEDSLSKREVDMAELRKSMAGLQRERSDLQGALEATKGELARSVARRTISGQVARSKSGFESMASPQSDLGEEDEQLPEDQSEDEDVFGTRQRRRTGDGLGGLLSPGRPVLEEDDEDSGDFSFGASSDALEQSPAMHRGRQYSEAETLRTSLAHAHKTISTLRAALTRERGKRSVGDIDVDDSAYEDIQSPEPAAKRLRGAVTLRRGRNGKLPTRGQIPSSLSREYYEDQEGEGDSSIVEHDEMDESQLEELNLMRAAEVSDGRPQSRLTPSVASLEGFDPAFVHLLDQGREDFDSRRSSLVGLGRRTEARSTRPTSGMFSSIPELLNEMAATFEDACVGTDPTKEPEPRVVEVIKEVEKVVEKIVEKIVQVQVEKVVEVPVERIVEIQVEKRIEVPVEKIIEVQVEKRIEVPVEKIVNVPERVEVEKIIYVPERFEVKVPEYIEVERIKEVPVEVIREVIKEVIKEVPVDRVREVPTERIVDRIVERIVEVPVEKIVEKVVDRIVEVEKIVYVTSSTVGEHAGIQTDAQIPVASQPYLSQSSSRDSMMTATAGSTPASKKARKTMRNMQPYSDADSTFETETEAEYEDARESVRAPTPAMSMMGRSGSDFYSLRNERDGTESIAETMFDTPNGRRSTMQYYAAVSRPPTVSNIPVRVHTIEAGVQTDAMEPEQFALPIASIYSNSSHAISAASPVYLQAIQSVMPFTPVSNSHDRTDLDADKTPTAVQTPKEQPLSISMPAPPTTAPPKQLSPKKAARPSRPLSPPPADLLQRAQTPSNTFSSLQRAHASTPVDKSQPASVARNANSTMNLRKEPLRASELGMNTTRSRTGTKSAASRRGLMSSSAASVLSCDRHSRQSSVASSVTSDGLRTDGLPVVGNEIEDRLGGSSTDPAVIHAITQTMIGEFLFKYTRKVMGTGNSEKRHRRFFWVHPYTRTLYWSTNDPASASAGNQSSAKSIFIEGVRQVADPNSLPPGLHQQSIILQTPGREIKITAPTQERHKMWYNAINYLLARPSLDPSKDIEGSPRSQSLNQGLESSTVRSKRKWSTPTAGRSSMLGNMYSQASASDSNLVATNTYSKAKGRLSTASTMHLKRPETPAAQFMAHHAAFGSPRSVRSYETDDVESTFGDESMEMVHAHELGHVHDDGFEGLENVRVCCNEHDVAHLAHKKKLSQHRHHQRRTDENIPPVPSSPSFRIIKASNDVQTAKKPRKLVGGLFNPPASPTKQSI